MDWNLVTLVVVVILTVVGAAVYFGVIHPPNPSPSPAAAAAAAAVSPKIYVMQTPAPPPQGAFNLGLRAPVTLPTRPGSGRYEQIGILTGEGGSSGSAAPDRTILPLFGRELDSRRGKWNYFTRTDGNNPVQVPVRYRNRVCDDEMVGCEEVSSDDQVHVPSLGRSFAATVYRRSIFG
jgi:hypothetical protein